MKKLIPIVTLTIMLAGCAQASPPEAINDKITLAAIQTSVQGVFPDCDFETVTSSDGQIYKSDIANRAYEETSPVYQDINYLDGGGFTLTSASLSKEYYFCNTKGLKISQATTYDHWLGKNNRQKALDVEPLDCEWIINGRPSQSQINDLRQCEQWLDSNQKFGFWLIVHEFESSNSAKKRVKEVTMSLPGLFPVAISGRFVISATGPFDFVTQPAIEDFDRGWNVLVKELDAQTSWDLNQDASDSFDRGQWIEGKTSAGYNNGNRVATLRQIEQLGSWYK